MIADRLRLHSLAAWNVAASLLVFLTGILVARAQKDWMWFARSGAFVTAIELFVAVRRIHSLLRIEKFLETLQGVKGMKGMRISFEGIVVTKIPKKISEWQNRSQLVEAWLLMASTLIWGFGDLLGKIFK